MTNMEVKVSYHRSLHLPIVLASGLMDHPVTVPGGAAADSGSRRTTALSTPQRSRRMMVRGSWGLLTIMVEFLEYAAHVATDPVRVDALV